MDEAVLRRRSLLAEHRPLLPGGQPLGWSGRLPGCHVIQRERLQPFPAQTRGLSLPGRREPLMAVQGSVCRWPRLASVRPRTAATV